MGNSPTPSQADFEYLKSLGLLAPSRCQIVRWGFHPKPFDLYRAISASPDRWHAILHPLTTDGALRALEPMLTDDDRKALQWERRDDFIRTLCVLTFMMCWPILLWAGCHYGFH